MSISDIPGLRYDGRTGGTLPIPRTAFLGWVVVHHIIGVFFQFPLIVDAIFIGADIPVLAKFNLPLAFSLLSAKVLVVNVVAVWVLVAFLSFSFIGRIFVICDSIVNRQGVFWSFSPGGERVKDPAGFVSVFLGRSIVQPRISGEGRIIRSLRAFFASLLIVGMCFYAAYNLFLNPINETVLVPIKEITGESIPWDVEVAEPVWNIVMVRPFVNAATRTRVSTTGGSWDTTPDANTRIQMFHDAVTVTPLWDNSSSDNSPPCTHKPGAITRFVQDTSIPVEMISITCPGRVNATDFFDVTPDLLVRVNFTTLSVSPEETTNAWSNIVQIFVGFIDDEVSVTRFTTGVTVPSNVNQLVEVGIILRETFVSRLFSTLGMIDLTTIIPLASIKQILSDPLASTSSSSRVQIAENTSTVRLFTAINVNDRKVLQEFREKSILGGFAAVGGLWTFFDGIFAFFFGLTVFAILFESKPLSILGMVHGWRHRSLTKKYFDKYPNLKRDLVRLQQERGLLAFLQDNYVDAEPFLATLREDHPELIVNDTDPKKQNDLESSHLEFSEKASHPRGDSDLRLAGNGLDRGYVEEVVPLTAAVDNPRR
ncbi:hypothetical protein CVT24_005413 [Panaeolus cyanescens]|uniref:Uncharacterized protein n=1 Tax=Panaeolus cyanescens TaxID=181874 RepID=A0A409Y8M8_9AGAR|nr:hypothetical protein CVT24_005413 [Panaeolus cyanescens]